MTLWVQTGFTPKAPGSYIFYGSDFIMTLELPLPDAEKPSDFCLSPLYLLDMFKHNAFDSWLLLITHSSVNLETLTMTLYSWLFKKMLG